MDQKLLARRSRGRSNSMAKIKTFARIKPCEDLYDDFDCTKNRLYLRIPDSYSRDSTLYNRTRAPIVNHEFRYSQVFSTESSQDEVYNAVAKNIISGFLEGYNGTIFAYGQTASGKTYTMHGEPNSAHSGLTPRGLSAIFRAVNARRDAGENVTLSLSYLEIYQEVGYDLLKSHKNGLAPSSFAKVTVVDGPGGAAVVKNLSVRAVSTEEDAQAVLAQGQENRKIAETAMNLRSSRSHAVFTVYLSSRKGDLLVRSKMHFVDLAGSERVCKTGVKGMQLSEAKYINLSLHYLEGVIISLQQDRTSAHANIHPSRLAKSWSASPARRPYSAADVSGKPKHIPYRNSLLTMLLKDSLGGNCLTAMIATVSLELNNLSESISTCRFAQRVSCISNTARKNEEIDDKSMIKRLRTRVAELEAENNILKHGGDQSEIVDEQEVTSKLSEKDRELCHNVVQDFVTGRVLDPVVAGVTDPFKFRECMKIFKKLIVDYNNKSLRLAEKLKSQPSHVQEAFYAGGRFYEAPLAHPSKRQKITFRDDANELTRRTYSRTPQGSPKRNATPLKPTILRQRSQQGTQAWTTSANSSRAVTPGTTYDSDEDIPVAPQLVITSGPSSKPQSAMASYRTPYEKKQAKEMAHLNKQVETNLAKQLEETEHLKAFKNCVKEQEYEVIESALMQRLDVARNQVLEQELYVVKLQKDRHTDGDLIEQEKLVLKQLSKRRDKIQEDLKNVKNRLTDLRLETAKENRSTNERVSQPGSANQRTLSDKFGNMVKPNGVLDTVKVKSSLQQQKTLQHKIQKSIDQQRIMVIDKQLEVKEISTRQKLEEFKRKLAESQGKITSTSTPSTASRNDSYKQTKERENDKRHVTLSKPLVAASAPTAATNSKSTSKKPDNRGMEEDRQKVIDDIIAKYKKPDSGSMALKTPQSTNDRSHNVDQILAKYRQQNASPLKNGSKQPSTPGPASDSGYNSPESNNPPSQKAKVKVSLYENSPPTTYHTGAKLDREKRDTLYSKPSDQKNFESTLRSVVKMRTGTTPSKPAWDDRATKPAWRATGAPQEEKDLLKLKLQKYITNQTKRKREESTNQNSHRHQSSNQHRAKSQTTYETKQREKAKSKAKEYNNQLDLTNDTTAFANKSTHPVGRSSAPNHPVVRPLTQADYSHRISYYQNLTNSKPEHQTAPSTANSRVRKPGLAMEMALKFIREEPSREATTPRDSIKHSDQSINNNHSDKNTSKSPPQAGNTFVVDLKKYRNRHVSNEA